MDLLSGLNVQQQQAVTAGQGPILVLAGPGSGKTRVLTHRIAHVIGNMGVRPYHILAVTFTNKAARVMEARVASLLQERTRGLSLGTFHAICAQILRRESEHLPIGANFVIYDADDQLKLVKQALDDLNLDDKRYRPQSVHSTISFAKNELRTPDDFPAQDTKAKTIQKVFRRYQELLLASNAVDFDDLLLYTARLLEEEAQVRAKYAQRFEYVLVDEFQDTNVAQYEIVKHLSSFHHNIFAVGDADQSIYRWRGADYRNVQRFRKDFPDAQVILLEQNYRSTQTILDVAMAVIDQNPNRIRKQLFTERGKGEKVTLVEAYNDYEEASYVVSTIVEMAHRKQAKLGDFAVMYRTNAQSRVLEEAFIRANLPYKIVGAQRFYGRREVKDVLAYLRVVYNPKDEVSLWRAINTPPRKIGEKTVETLRMQAQAHGLSSGEYLLLLHPDADGAAFSAQAFRSLVSFAAKLSAWHAMAQTETSVLSLLDRVLEDVEYRAYIDDGTEEGQGRWENVMELRRLAVERSEQDLASFLEQIALVADQDTIQENADVPIMLTLHAAKGLEFPVVFIVGINDGMIPHSRSFDEPEAMMEERRLFYVGITRAEDRLILLYTQMSASRGFPEAAEQSRFLDEVSHDLLEEYKPSQPRKGQPTGVVRAQPIPAPQTAAPRWESARRAAQEHAPAAPAEKQYAPGMRVEHPNWGVGLILNAKREDGDEIIDIFFEDIGLKRVVASFARLKIIS